MTTKTKQTHTPPPWVVRPGLDLAGIAPYFVGETLDGKRTPFQSISQVNAAYIVRAVNAHEDMLNLLRYFDELFPTLPADVRSAIPMDWVIRLGKVVAQAKEEGRAIEDASSR